MNERDGSGVAQQTTQTPIPTVVQSGGGGERRYRGDVEETDLPNRLGTSSTGEILIPEQITHTDDDVLHELDRYRRSIGTYQRCAVLVDLLNIQLYGNGGQSLTELVLRFYRENIHCRTKVNCGFGYMLRHNTTGELRYFHSSPNNMYIFNSPQHANTEQQLLDVINALSEVDILEYARQQRPNTAWSVLAITNLTLFFYKSTPFNRIGTPIELPDYITKTRSILSLTKRKGEPYDDNLCFFRCISIPMYCKCSGKCSCKIPKERRVKELFERYRTMRVSLDDDEAVLCDIANVHAKNFPGIDIESEMLLLENLYEINVVVLKMMPDETSQVVWVSRSKYGKTVYLNLYGQHLSLIKRIESYSKTYSCELCDVAYTTVSNFKRHKCSKATRLTFPHQCYAPSMSVMEKIIREIGIPFPDAMSYYPYFITWDCECYLDKDNLPPSTDRMEFINEHKLLSISVCSNVPDYTEPKCMITDGSTDKLVGLFVDYLMEIAEKARTILVARYSDTIEEIERFIAERKAKEAKWQSSHFSSKASYAGRDLDNMLHSLYEYLGKVPVVGFNSQRYDLLVMKGPLLRILTNRVDGKPQFVVKRETKLQAIETPNLRFLDICNYIAPGFNYERYLKAFDCTLEKGFFPYEYVDSLAKLNETCLPSHDSFYSTLKQSNITDSEYELCQRVWTEKGMSTMREFLIWYNNLDVEPFCQAIAKQSQIYRVKGIDMLKDAISLPGLAVKWKFTEMNRNTFDIPLIDVNNSDLHNTVKDNLVGGPSIVFHRHHEKGVTRLREETYGSEAKLCERVVGFDANALYLWSMSQPMPTGFMIRRHETNNFKPEFTQRFGRTAWGFLEWVAARNRVHIQHMFNAGEKRVGQHGIPVDGYCEETNTVYQFHGCYWHGHACRLTAGKDRNEKTGKTFTELQNATLEKERYIRDLGYNLVTITECKWKDEISENVAIASFLSGLLHRTRSNERTLTQDEIIAAIRCEGLFGMVECDIEVPENLREKFAEMPPIFKNIEIERSALSDHMLSFAQERNILTSPQRTLVGSMFATKILLHSSLAKWYLEKGLTITRIYQVISYQPRLCFSNFAQSVSNARREGDADPSKALIADTAKLVGNSVYGKTITNKLKHRNVTYHSDPRQVSLKIKSPKFRHLEEFQGDFWEVESAKGFIKMDTPIVIGFTILQYAKLRMLQFYYDCLLRYVDRRDFAMCQMDTDSAYMALSGDFESLIKPELQDEFYSEYGDWFPRPYCDAHKLDFKGVKDIGAWEWDRSECSDCTDTYNYDRRTPGLFKEEFDGEGIIALNSKTYYCWSSDGSKMSTKGINKKLNPFTRQQFLDVLQSRNPVSGINRGFVLRNQCMNTYKQLRTGLTYFYAKRKVHADGVTTSPLDV